ncbi:MAG: hypothetical protein WC870_01300 [Candidatus Paceibacterota bacterium]
MDRKKLLRHLLYIILFIFVANFAANKFFWYSSVWYLDMIMHFLGGFWLGLAFLWFLLEENLSFALILKIILGVLFVGILWEIFELLFNNIVAQNPFNILDTSSDLFFDISGGLCAILYIWRKQLK